MELLSLSSALDPTNKQLNHYIFDVLEFCFSLGIMSMCSGNKKNKHFFTMKLVKSPLRSKMENDFMIDCMIIYIEREIADTVDLKYIICEFDCIKSRKIKFK
ncbi:hypothetical protein ACOSP7_019644 [Xanthoceras sorbifolium]